MTSFIKLTNSKTGSHIAVRPEDVVFIGVAQGGKTEVALKFGTSFIVHEKFGEVFEKVTGEKVKTDDAPKLQITE